jgi:hypothetical protein
MQWPSNPLVPDIRAPDRMDGIVEPGFLFAAAQATAVP